MNILYVTQYYPPEIGATQTRALEMASNLVRQGHRVTVLTEFPNHPLGVIPRHYRGKLFERKAESGIDVLRVWVYARPRKDFLARILFYLSFMGSATLAGVILRGRFDLVFASSPPLFVAAAGQAIAAVKRRPFFMEVRDIWPESAVILGELSNKPMIHLSEHLEKFLYRKAVRIVGVTEGIIDRLGERGVPAEKRALIPNGANTALYRPGQKDPEFLASLGINSETFVVAYTGLHGLMHGLDFILDVAKSLEDEPDIRFLFIGEGVRKQSLIERSRKLGLRNVLFLPAQAETELPKYLQNSDAGLVTTKRMDFCRGTLPVKMFTYMACAIPVLLCVQGEAQEILARAQAGLPIKPEDSEGLREAILRLKADPRLCREFGKNGRAFVEAYYSRSQFARDLERCFIESLPFHRERTG